MNNRPQINILPKVSPLAELKSYKRARLPEFCRCLFPASKNAKNALKKARSMAQRNTATGSYPDM